MSGFIKDKPRDCQYCYYWSKKAPHRTVHTAADAITRSQNRLRRNPKVNALAVLTGGTFPVSAGARRTF